MEGCHWERKVILLLISVFHRDQPGSQMVRAGVMQLLCAALGDQPGSQMVRARSNAALMKHWEEGCGDMGRQILGRRAAFRSGDQVDAQWGKNKPRIVQRHQRHSHGTLRSLWEDFEKILHRQKG